MSDWVDKEIDRLEKDYEEGGMSYKELQDAISDVLAEQKGQAEEAAERAYNDVMGNW